MAPVQFPRRLGNWVSNIELPHITEVRFGKPVAVFPGEVPGDLFEERFAVLGAEFVLLLDGDDPLADLPVGAGEDQVEGAAAVLLGPGVNGVDLVQEGLVLGGFQRAGHTDFIT